MRAQNLTIAIPNKAGTGQKDCDKNCPYCISNMTFWPGGSFIDMTAKMPKVKKLAEMANVTSILLTGKGEPFLNFNIVREITHWFKEYPLEIQTNGIWLNFNKQDPLMQERLVKSGIDVIAFSLDRVAQFEEYAELFVILRNLNFILRITLNVSNLLNGISFAHVLALCLEHGVHQLMIRKLSTPDNVPETDPTAQWIYTNAPANLFEAMIRELNAEAKTRGFPVRDLPFTEDGQVVTIYDIEGVSVAASRFCIQESNKSKDIRSLIWLPDGHIYTSWGSRASILF